jgi:alpha-galactosidase
MKARVSFFFSLLIGAVAFGQQLEWSMEKDSLFVRYAGHSIMSAHIRANTGVALRTNSINDRIEGKAFQFLTINASDGKILALDGVISSPGQSISCESDARENGLRVVHHSYGKANNLLHNAVYCRDQDWLLSFDVVNQQAHVRPTSDDKYAVNVTGREINIRFRPKYYKEHRGLYSFDPASYQVWQQPVVGWCSWFAYFNKVTEQDISRTADVLSKKLLPYGLQYLQIDDGYQQEPIGMPDTWLRPNKKFASGLKSISAYIASKGLVPGIWTNVSFADSAAAFAHPNLFVKNQNNQPAKGNWVGYVMDGSNPASIGQLISPVYKGLVDSGWRYFKLDALRHLRYEGYNSYKDYFINKNSDAEQAFSNVVQSVRRETGQNNFLLACWGIRPELVGLADGCRIGNDGYSYAGLAQFNSYNNIIWRNDPDHIELSDKEAFRSCTATSLTGSLFMLTDKPEVYEQSQLIEAAIRSIPVLFTQPGQVYDVDPSRSSRIVEAKIELSGSGPRPFDAGNATTTGLFALDIATGYENYQVLGRLDDRDKVLSLEELGLDKNNKYHVFEFWTKQYLGVASTQFVPPAISNYFGCQVFCFRQVQSHPQLLATNRHISCGALEVKSVEWQNNCLAGNSELVPGDVYEMYVIEPAGYQMKTVELNGAALVANVKEGSVRKLSVRSNAATSVNWKICYE